MDAFAIAHRFPLVARPRPQCPPLSQRIGEVSDMASAADRGGTLALAAAAQNKAALIASDCGLPELARTLCWRHSQPYLNAKPLNAQTARYALEPLVNLARLLIRDGDGDAAYHLLDTLFQAVTSRTGATIAGRHVDFDDLTARQEDHRTLRQWLWSVLLADGTRALARAGRWDQAYAHVQRHNGVGQRLLDGRQIAVVFHLVSGAPGAALALLQHSVPSEPWEQAVAACMTVLCQTIAAPGPGSTVSGMVDRYLSLTAAPGLALFQVRLGLTVAQLAGAADQYADVERAAAGALQEALNSSDGYLAREVLTDHTVQGRLSSAQQHSLSAVVQSAGLDHRGIPENLKADLLNAVEMAGNVTTRQVVAQTYIQ